MRADAMTESVEAIAHAATSNNLTVAAAESLTSGALLSALGRGDHAADWFRGGVVAYSAEVKAQVLGVSPGPVITARCAEEMAVGVARLLEADVAVATTGAGGPDPEEGQQPGTVYLGWFAHGRSGSELHLFDGSPSDIVEQTVTAALGLLRQALS